MLQTCRLRSFQGFIFYVLLVMGVVTVAAEHWRGFGPFAVRSYVNDSGVDTVSQPSSVLFEDLNRDGHMDFLIDGISYGQSNTGDYVRKAQIFLNQGNGTFSNGVALDKGHTHRFITDAANVTGNAFPDLLVPYFWGNNFGLWRGQNGTAFSSVADYASFSSHAGPARYHDFDGDGDLDIVFLSSGSGVPVRIHFYVNNGGVFSKFPTYYGYENANSPNAFIFYNNLLLADLNRDGLMDIFVKAMDGTRALTLLKNGTGGFSFVQKNFDLVTGGAAFSGGEWFDALDMNGDGYQDLVSTTDNALYIWHNDTAGNFPSLWSRQISLPALGNRSFFVDVDQDGDKDLITRSPPYPTEMRITTYLNQGNFSFQAAEELIIDTSAFTDYLGYNAIGVQDLNADGFVDVVAVGKDDKVYISLNLGTADIVRSSPRGFHAYAGGPVNYTLTTTPAADSFAATGLPGWLALDPDTGELTGTAPSIPGKYTLAFTATKADISSAFSVELEIAPSPALPLDTDLSAPALQWRSTGDRPWKTQSAETHDGVDGLAAPGLPAGSGSTLETDIIGPKVLSGFWKRSVYSQELTLQLDNSEQQEAGVVENAWSFFYLAIPAGTHTVSFRFDRTQDIPQTVWLDQLALTDTVITSEPRVTAIAGVPFEYNVTVAPAGSATRFTAMGLPAGLNMDPQSGRISGIPEATGLFPVQLTAYPASGVSDSRRIELEVESGISPYLETEDLNIIWIPDPVVNWFGQNTYTLDGVDAMQSPDLSVIGYPWLTAPARLSGTLTVTSPSQLTFWWRTQTVHANNKLTFHLNGVLRETHAGRNFWTRSSYTLTPGAHTLSWAYDQGWGTGGELDAVWVDMIAVTSLTGSYQQWSSYHNLSGTEADPDGDMDQDTIPNAMEYILATDPRSAAHGIPDQALQLQMNRVPETGDVTWSWRQRSGGNGQRGVDYRWQDAVITLQTTTDLVNGPWEDATELTEHEVTPHADGTETVSILVPGIAPGTSIQSARLRITLE